MKQNLSVSYEHLASREDMSAQEQQLFDKAQQARKMAYAPYSGFAVGCALLLENGEIITGSNQENAALPSGTCAERATIFWAKSNFPQTKIKKIMVVGGPADDNKTVLTAPCGACRQSLLEYEMQQQVAIPLIFSSAIGEAIRTESIRSLLPFCFDGTEL